VASTEPESAGAPELAIGAQSEAPAKASRQQARPPARRAGLKTAREVEALVKAVRERLIEKLGREPSGEEVAAEMTKDGHGIKASRVRTYLARLRAEERKRPAEEVVAWHA
jgi:hypothetical protein